MKIRTLKTLDRWLLKNQPLIWRTRIHWVLFGSVVVHLLVYVGYLLYPLSMSNVELFRMSHIPVRNAAYAVSFFALLYWGYSTARVPIRSKQLSGYLLTGFLYWLGFLAVAFNVWTANDQLNKKIGGLVSENEMRLDKVHMQRITKSINYYDVKKTDVLLKNRVKELEQIKLGLNNKRFNINKIVQVYEIDLRYKNRLSQFMDSGYTIFTFYDNFGTSISDVFKEVENKQKIIDNAHKTNRDWRNRIDYMLLHLIVIILLIFAPLLFTMLANIKIAELLLVAFSQFLLIGGMGLLYGVSSMLLTYVLLGVVVAIGLFFYNKNNGFARTLQLFVVTMIPIAGLLYTIDYQYNILKSIFTQHYTIVWLLYALSIALFAVLVYWNYTQRVSKPTIE